MTVSLVVEGLGRFCRRCHADAMARGVETPVKVAVAKRPRGK